MKKTLLALCCIILMMMQSCSVNTDVTLHKDTTSSLLLNAEFKELMDMVKQQGGADGKMEGLDKLPKEWTSLYDMELKEGKKVKNPDSIRLMKKMFVKGNYLINDITGMSVRMDRFTKADYKTIENLEKNSTEAKLPVNNKFAVSWDGKKIVLNTKDVSMKGMDDLVANGSSEDGEEMDPEQTSQMMKMMLKKMVTNLKFESDIKSITGKHDWIKQIDKRTVRIEYDINNLDQSTKLTNNDPQIVIVTE